MSKLAEKLRILRAKSGLKNKEIAELIGKSEQTVSGYMSVEKGYNPDLDTLKKLAEIFNVTVDYLLNGNDTNINKDTVNEKSPFYGMRPKEIELLKEIEKLSQSDQEQIWEIVNTIVEFRKRHKG